MLTFYSLPQSYSTQIQKEIHQLIYFNNGGYNWYHVYNHMPVHIRKYLLKQTEKIKKKEAQQAKKARGSQDAGQFSGPPSGVRNALKGSP